eukprot:Em0003g818a
MAKWSLFKKLRVPTTPKGPRTVNIVFGYFFVINYIIGTGFLGIPYSFYHAGMLTSIATLCVVSFLVWSTASWLLEVMARAQALETLKNEQMSNAAEADKDPPPSSSKDPLLIPSRSEGPRFEILLTRKFELTELCQVFLSKWFKIIFLVVITLSSFLALWSFSTVGGSGWSTNLPLNIGPFRICSDGEFHDTLVPSNPGCLASYRFCLFLFALIVVPLSCLELKELGFIQAILGIARFTIIASIILYCLAKLAESPLIEHTIPSNSTSNRSGPIINTTCSGPQASSRNFVLDFSVVGWVLSIPVFTYAQTLHPGIPSLTHPIKQKKGLHWFMAAIFGTTLFCYMTLGIVVSLWFRGNINETASLNWVPLTKPGHHVALRALSYIIILFPTLDVISAYPLITCSMVNNLYQVIMGRDTSQRKHSYDGLILVAMRAVVAILPIVCSLFISNLVYILKYGGLVGFLTAFFFPLALQLASQYKCVRVFGKELAPAAAARGTPLQPHVDTEMEVLKKDGEEGGAELTEGSEDELGREKAGKKGRSPPPLAKAKSLYITPYSIPGLSHPVAVVMTGLLGGATFVIALVSLAYSVELKCP